MGAAIIITAVAGTGLVLLLVTVVILLLGRYCVVVEIAHAPHIVDQKSPKTVTRWASTRWGEAGAAGTCV